MFVSEGNLLPSKTELILAKKGQFDLYTITNMSFMDIAEYLTMRPNLFAVTKHNLSDRQEVVVDFTNESHFNLFRNQNNLIQNEEPSIENKEFVF